jgi:hypothetical protein
MAEMLILRLVHITSGVFWAGALLFVVLFLEPTLRAAGAEGGRIMGRLGASNYPIVMTIAGTLTVLSGFRMYMIDYAASPNWLSSRMGITLTVGATIAVVGFGIGMVVLRPAVARMGVLGQALQVAGGAPAPSQVEEAGMLRGRIAGASRVVAALLTVAVVAMAVARYLG